MWATSLKIDALLEEIIKKLRNDLRNLHGHSVEIHVGDTGSSSETLP